ncbi:hypothetical protein PR048_009540 [Dryococelus australis]|uniref:Uncharacterized protein n=1 Tax=Dryococelus australis TaxID=614101 RepID=A0ABQ9I147_9NEOP|nr:hypothetical protein PR048_009540 [Dryococelus australis]
MLTFTGHCQQENFLANVMNKTKLIELLVETLTVRGIEASSATGDTDDSIVRCGLNKVTSHSSVVVIGEDVDLLVLLTVLTPPERNVGKPGRENIEGKVYSTRQLQELPLVYLSLSQAGDEMFLTMYRAPPSERDLNNHRYNSFVKSSTKAIANLASLSPSQGSAKQHSFRVYLPTQQWLDNDSLNPARWGWVRDDGGVLNPVKTTYPIAPDSVLI